MLNKDSICFIEFAKNVIYIEMKIFIEVRINGFLFDLGSFGLLFDGSVVEGNDNVWVATTVDDSEVIAVDYSI